ncbi:MAG: DUF4286 family protein [Ekhidna sp.]|nr:DUF4286 family protein [Ekhidna sp.]MBC6409976.1 DUF4286 family protein [Ekhidna sp.]MBC6426908.1 DUF4286 family protein [Ekhidna sp.]
MVLYNVTVNIDEDVEQDWIQWMKNIHIPEVMETGFFEEYRMMKMLSESPDEAGKTYAIQYIAEDLFKVETYLDTVAPKLQKQSIIRYGTKLAAFRTVLEEV